MKISRRNILIIALLLFGLGVYFGVIPLSISPPDITQPETTEYVYIQGLVQDPLASSAVASATVKVVLPDGNIATYTADSNGKFTSTNMFPEGSEVTIQVEKSGYYTAVYTVEVPEGDWSSRDTADIGVLYLYDISGSNSMSVTDNHGNSITGSSAYNKTQYGEDFTLNVLFTVDEDDAAAVNSYTDIDTGYNYIGPILVVKVTDVTKVSVEFSYDKVVTIGTDYYYIIYADPVYNDANDPNDGTVTFQLAFRALNTGTDLISIYFYDQVRDIYIDSANFGTALASVTGIDIV